MQQVQNSFYNLVPIHKEVIFALELYFLTYAVGIYASKTCDGLFTTLKYNF